MRIFSHHIAPQVLLIAVADFVLASASVYAAYFLLRQGVFGGVGPEAPMSMVRTALFAGVVTAGIGAMGLYSVQQRYRIEGILARIVLGIALAAVGFAVVQFLLGFDASRSLWVLAFALSFALVGTTRFFISEHMDGEVFRRRVLVYGAGKRAARILELRRRSDQRGFRIVGFVPAAADSMVIDDPRVLRAPVPSLLEYAREQRVTEIVVAMDDRRQQFPIGDLLQCKLSGIRIIDLLGFLERETGRVKVDMVNPSWLIFSDGFSRLSRNEFGFRILDLLTAAVLTILTAPIMALIALAIVIDDGRPILYRQRRVGKNGRVFTLYKFRSMRKDAEAAGGAVWADSDDVRVTRVGDVLRRFRLDELPQLLNVLNNDMSFVGPRPERPEFVEQLACRIPYYHERHYVKPGLAGWAQLCYPYGASEQDALAKLEYDIYYVKNRSVIFNLMILLQTAEVVLWQKGAR